jgi:hypothetical protein
MTACPAQHHDSDLKIRTWDETTQHGLSNTGIDAPGVTRKSDAGDKEPG